MEQPVSNGTKEDVDRIVRRDFIAAEVDAALTLLDAHETSSGEARIRLAALKCANGDLNRLKRALEEASVDYRDVLVEAEYPIYYTLNLRSPKPSKAECEEAMRQDWKNYNEWLVR